MNESWHKLSFGGDDNRHVVYFAGREFESFGVDAYDLVSGKVQDNWNPNSCFRSDLPEDDGTPDDVLCENFAIPTFSPRLQTALAVAGIGLTDLQFLPVRLIKSTHEELSGFAIANVVTRIPALDRAGSFLLTEDEEEIDPLTGKPNVTGVWTAALKKELLVGHDIIRLTEFFPPVFVSERFAKVFREGHFTGAILKPVPVL